MKVLVPVEDPLFGAAIVELISQHKWPAGSQFIVVHVIEPYLLDKSAHITFKDLLEANQEQVVNNAAKLVNSVAQAINNHQPDLVVSQEVVQAHAKEQIIRMACNWKADLVIVGTHGRSGFDRFVLGSVSFALTSELKVPMLLVRPDARVLDSWSALDESAVARESIDGLMAKIGQRKVRRILLALDDTTLSHQLIEFVANHEWEQDNEFRLLTVIDPPADLFFPAGKAKQFFDELAFVSETRLHDFRRKMRTESQSVQIETTVRKGRPQKVILQEAKEWQADLIVVGCHFRSALGRFLLGSVSFPVLCQAPCSVLLIKEKLLFGADAASGDTGLVGLCS